MMTANSAYTGMTLATSSRLSRTRGSWDATTRNSVAVSSATISDVIRWVTCPATGCRRAATCVSTASDSGMAMSTMNALTNGQQQRGDQDRHDQEVQPEDGGEEAGVAKGLGDRGERDLQIRDVPDETSAELASRAALTGRSLQEYLRARLVELASGPDAEVWLSSVRARKAATGGSISVERLLAHRDADRR